MNTQKKIDPYKVGDQREQRERWEQTRQPHEIAGTSAFPPVSSGVGHSWGEVGRFLGQLAVKRLLRPSSTSIRVSWLKAVLERFVARDLKWPHVWLSQAAIVAELKREGYRISKGARASVYATLSGNPSRSDLRFFRNGGRLKPIK